MVRSACYESGLGVDLATIPVSSWGLHLTLGYLIRVVLKLCWILSQLSLDVALFRRGTSSILADRSGSNCEMFLYFTFMDC